ncbi:MAG TPA: hypothetical protein VMT53_11070 [Terriglobales bacterium]|nr:hypothetical protein [Terriglobales bacterium]
MKIAVNLLIVLAMCAMSLATDTITMKDGTKHTGTFLGATSRLITFREGKTVHHYKAASLQSIDFGSGDAGTATAENSGQTASAARRKEVSIPAGTEIAVLTNQAIDSKGANEGQTFPADVAEDVKNDAGQVVIPKGSPAELVIRKVSSGGVTSNAELSLDLQSLKVGDRRYVVNTADLEQQGSGGIGMNKRTGEMVGGGAALGTLIGAIAGHGKGAAIGAVTGAAAGAGAQILTKGKSVQVPAETTLRFKLDKPLRLDAAY